MSAHDPIGPECFGGSDYPDVPTSAQRSDADEIAARPNVYRGPHVQLINGDPWYPYSPRTSEVRLAHVQALSRTNRFGGHARVGVELYNNAQHSVLVAKRVHDLGGVLYDCFAALGHDSHESVPPGDVVGPFLRAWSDPKTCALLGLTPAAFDGIAAVVQLAKMCFREALGIAHAFADPRSAALIRRADAEVLATERRDLMATPGVDWGNLPAPLPGRIVPWGPDRAWGEFLDIFHELGGDKIAMPGVV